MRVGRLAAAAAVLIAGIGAVGGGATRAAAASAAMPGVSLVSQTTVVRTGHDFLLRLAIPAPDRGQGRLALAIWPMLNTRGAFDQAALGHPDGSAVWSDSVSLGDPGTHGAVVSTRIPVGTVSTGRQLAEFEPGASSGVYPLSVQLETAVGAPVGPALSTFLVDDAGGFGFAPLAVSVTVDLPSLLTDPLGLPTSAGVAALAQRVRTLESSSGVPVTLSVLPRTLASLALSGPGRSVLGGLRQLASDGDEYLPGPWTSVSLPAMLGAGLTGEVGAQLDNGAAALAAAVGGPVDTTTWEGSDLDGSTLDVLRARGLRNLVVPANALRTLPASVVGTTTYGHALALAAPPGGPIDVIAADPTLSARAAQDTDPVLAAEQTLAELAMVHFEEPSIERGVALLPPDSAVSDRYYAVLLAGLRRNPFATALTAHRLVEQIPPVTTHRAVLAPVAAPALDGAGSIAALQRESTAIAGVVPGDHSLEAQLAATVLLAPTAALSPAERTALLDHAFGLIDAVQRTVAFPGSTSVTLTSLKANLPLTILSSSRRPLHVELVLDSSKLAFRRYAPGGGTTCAADNRGHETCQLVLDKRQTTLRVPVEARTSGVFTLMVSLRSPDGSLRLAGVRDTIRSAAVSFVGLVIIVVAVLFLAVWWLRDIRSGRRARMLVDRPGEDGDDPPDGGAGPDERGGPPDHDGSDRPVSRPEPERVPVGAG